MTNMAVHGHGHVHVPPHVDMSLHMYMDMLIMDMFDYAFHDLVVQHYVQQTWHMNLISEIPFLLMLGVN